MKRHWILGMICLLLVTGLLAGCVSGVQDQETGKNSSAAENTVDTTEAEEETTEEEQTTGEETTEEQTEEETDKAAETTAGRDVTSGKWVMNVFDYFFYDCYFYYEDGELVKCEIRFSKGGGDEDMEIMVYEGDDLPSCEYYGKTPEEIREMMKDYGADMYNWQKWE